MMRTMLRRAAWLLLFLRYGLLAATLYLSFHHWMREGYWEFSGVWQYGLPLLDPRFAAALQFWIINSTFWVCCLLPTAQWLAVRIPASSAGRSLVAMVLAIGLGTRGLVGPLLMRAALGSPMVPSTPGEQPAGLWLVNPYLARLAVVMTELWWLLPFLITVLWLLGAKTVAHPRVQWSIRSLLVAYALFQPLDAAYLLTAGGPRGATQSLGLLAFQEGFGRQEFGYASVLAVLLSFAALPFAYRLSRQMSGLPPIPYSRPVSGKAAWIVLAIAMVAPLGWAWLRNPGAGSWVPSAWLPAVSGLALAISSGAWASTAGAVFARGSNALRHRLYDALKYWALLLPPLTLILPMIRPWGYQRGVAEAIVCALGIGLLAPHSILSTVAHQLLRRRQVVAQQAWWASGLVVAWATWTELGLSVMLTQSQYPWLPLQSWIAWELSTTLRATPLAVPGWPLAWMIGTGLAWLALRQVFRAAETS